MVLDGSGEGRGLKRGSKVLYHEKWVGVSMNGILGLVLSCFIYTTRCRREKKSRRREELTREELEGIGRQYEANSEIWQVKEKVSGYRLSRQPFVLPGGHLGEMRRAGAYQVHET